MSQLHQIKKAIRSTLALWLLTAIIYPTIMLIMGFVFPYQANGSLIIKQGTVVGSELIGQPFKSNRYFWSRPSAVDYSTKAEVVQTGTSGASNLAPSNPELIQQIQGRIQNLKQANIQPTADLVYTSASGLDPHITIEAAQAQVQRIAGNRRLETQKIQQLINNNIDGRFLGIFGEPGVNVLKLNMALDNLS
jgi:potassium-transporting ATPase KdpC subunit